jgi:hypothetical protein
MVQTWRRIAVAWLALGVMLNWMACNRPTDGKVSKKLTIEEARQFSDGVTADLLNQQTSVLWGKAEPAFRATVDELGFARMLHQMYETYGAPLEFEFKQVEHGNKGYEDDEMQELYKFWYAARTSKAEKGQYFLFVDVVKDDGNLAFSSFAMVEFQGETPQNLR